PIRTRRRATPTPGPLPRRRRSAIVRERRFGGLRRGRCGTTPVVLGQETPDTGLPGATPPLPVAEGSPRPSARLRRIVAGRSPDRRICTLCLAARRDRFATVWGQCGRGGGVCSSVFAGSCHSCWASRCSA